MDIIIRESNKNTYIIQYDVEAKVYVSSPELETLGKEILTATKAYAVLYTSQRGISHATDEIASDLMEYILKCIPKYNHKKASLNTFIWSCCKNRAGNYFHSQKINETLGICTKFNCWED